MSENCKHRYQYIIDVDKVLDDSFEFPIYTKGVIVQCSLCYKQKQMSLEKWNKYKKDKHL